MPGRYRRAYTTLINTTRDLKLLANPIPGNYAILNSWSPGYSVLVKDKTDDGFEYEHKVFRATTSLEAAVAFLRDYYGNKEFLKFKDDAHPGHVSLLTSANYLSAGADVTTLNQVGFNTQHKITFTNKFEKDCYGFERLPEKMIDLHSLNISEINESMNQLLLSKKFYNILGGRFNFAEGESCATACYICLVAGGLNELLRADHKLLSRHTVLTPTSLTQYIETAKANELEQFPDARNVSKQFNLSRSDFIEKIAKVIEQAKQAELDAYVRAFKEKNKNTETDQFNFRQ
jgi:hypothetical protein